MGNKEKQNLYDSVSYWHRYFTGEEPQRPRYEKTRLCALLREFYELAMPESGKWHGSELHRWWQRWRGLPEEDAGYTSSGCEEFALGELAPFAEIHSWAAPMMRAVATGGPVLVGWVRAACVRTTIDYSLEVRTVLDDPFEPCHFPPRYPPFVEVHSLDSCDEDEINLSDIRPVAVIVGGFVLQDLRLALRMVLSKEIAVSLCDNNSGRTQCRRIVVGTNCCSEKCLSAFNKRTKKEMNLRSSGRESPRNRNE